jgi:hypothetical protein
MIYVDKIPIHFRSVPGGQQNTSIASLVSWSNNPASLFIAVINTPTPWLKELPKGVFGCNMEASDSVHNLLIRSDFVCTASKI